MAYTPLSKTTHQIFKRNIKPSSFNSEKSTLDNKEEASRGSSLAREELNRQRVCYSYSWHPADFVSQLKYQFMALVYIWTEGYLDLSQGPPGRILNEKEPRQTRQDHILVVVVVVIVVVVAFCFTFCTFSVFLPATSISPSFRWLYCCIFPAAHWVCLCSLQTLRPQKTRPLSLRPQWRPRPGPGGLLRAPTADPQVKHLQPKLCLYSSGSIWTANRDVHPH